MTEKLFETKEQPKRDTNFFRVGKREKSWYNQRTVLSAVVKEIRIWNPLMAIYWTHIMLHAGDKKWRDYLLKRLAVEASETFIDIETKTTVNSVMNICYSNTFGETDGIYHLVLLMSSRWKDKTMLEPFTAWRESRLWIKFEMLRTYLEWITPDIFSGKIKWVKPWSYVFDQHTAIGKKSYTAGIKIDNRFSGSTDWRRANLEIMLWKDLGTNPVDTDNDFPVSQLKETYKIIYDLEQLELPFSFPKSVMDVKDLLSTEQEKFNKEILNDIKILDWLWYYNITKA